MFLKLTQFRISATLKVFGKHGKLLCALVLGKDYPLPYLKAEIELNYAAELLFYCGVPRLLRLKPSSLVWKSRLQA